MAWHNFVIVGSGPAGVAAARRLEGQGTCIVDVGEIPDRDFAYTSLRASLAAGDLEALLGPRWETLANLVTPNRLHAKLRAAGLRHVARGERFHLHDGSGDVVLEGAGSYAAGGMSNAWGAQLFRFTEADLTEATNWPIVAGSLREYYEDLEAHIGIAGELDDMSEFLGETAHLLPPAPIVSAAQHLLAHHNARRLAKPGPLRLGRSRLAVLTRPLRGYSPYGFGETEFFSTNHSGIYTAKRTLDELRRNGRIEYCGRQKLVAYRELAEHVELDVVDCDSGASRTIRTRHLLLGCGTLHTTRLVLLNKNDFGRPLPFVDHPPALIPIFIPRMFGSALPLNSFPVQLVATLTGVSPRSMISFYYPGGLLWSDLLPDIPLPMDASLKLLTYLLGGMLVAQIWEASRPSHANRIQLDPGGALRLDYPDRGCSADLGRLLRALSPLGAFSLKRLATMAPPGWGFHYASSLPMRRNPGLYETHTDGRLWDSKRIRVIDGSVLPSLPAKNHSLTLMANAARIADEARRCGY